MPRRVLLLITDLEIGGTPTVVRELAIRLRDPGRTHVEVACLKGRGPVADQLEGRGIRVTALGARGVLDLPRTVHRLDQLIGSRLIDTCLSFLVHANVLAAVSGRFKREVRYFQSVQTTQPRPRWHWKVQGVVQHAARKVIVPSRSVGEVLQRRSSVAPERIVVIPNAVDVGEFSGRPPLEGGAAFNVGFLGRLDPVKRIPDLVRAVELLGPGYHLHVFGEGVERAAIEAAGARNVTLHGGAASPQDALAEMDVLVLPSEAEGFGLVLIEAMAAGVPVVATDVPGIRDVVRDGENGLLVPVGSPEGIAKALWRVREDAGLRARLIERGRADVVQRYTWPPVLRQYRQVLGLAEPQEMQYE